MSHRQRKQARTFQIAADDLVKVLEKHDKNPVSIRQLAREIGRSRRVCLEALELLQELEIVVEHELGGYHLKKNKIPKKKRAKLEIPDNINPERLRAMAISKFIAGTVENASQLREALGQSARWATQFVEELVAEGKLEKTAHGKYVYRKPGVTSPTGEQPDPLEPTLAPAKA